MPGASTRRTFRITSRSRSFSSPTDEGRGQDLGALNASGERDIPGRINGQAGLGRGSAPSPGVGEGHASLTAPPSGLHPHHHRALERLRPCACLPHLFYRPTDDLPRRRPPHQGPGRQQAQAATSSLLMPGVHLGSLSLSAGPPFGTALPHVDFLHPLMAASLMTVARALPEHPAHTHDLLLSSQPTGPHHLHRVSARRTFSLNRPPQTGLPSHLHHLPQFNGGHRRQPYVTHPA